MTSWTITDDGRTKKGSEKLANGTQSKEAHSGFLVSGVPGFEMPSLSPLWSYPTPPNPDERQPMLSGCHCVPDQVIKQEMVRGVSLAQPSIEGPGDSRDWQRSGDGVGVGKLSSQSWYTPNKETVIYMYVCL